MSRASSAAGTSTGAAPASDLRTTTNHSPPVTTPFQDRFTFEIDSFRKHCLLEGLDDIGITLKSVDKIDSFEAKQKAQMPWMQGARL